MTLTRRQKWGCVTLAVLLQLWLSNAVTSMVNVSLESVAPQRNYSFTQAPESMPRVIPFVSANNEQESFLRRCREAGYTNVKISDRTIAGVTVKSELLMSPCDKFFVDGAALDEHCDGVANIRGELGVLDAALLSDPKVVRNHERRAPKQGQGFAARGWGIAGPFTNKWRFYERHLRNVRRLGLIHLCEVGFLAGHSTALFSGLLGHLAFASVSVFDLPQPGTDYSSVGLRTIRSRFRQFSPNTSFDFYATLSREGVAAAIGSGRLQRCDFISLDGSKLVPDVIEDFRLLSHVAHNGTIVVCDDVWTTKLMNGVQSGAVSASDHNLLMASMVSLGLLEIVDTWHSDVDGWPAYGNVAFRFKKFGEAFDFVASDLMRSVDRQLGLVNVDAILPVELCQSKRNSVTNAFADACCPGMRVNKLLLGAETPWSEVVAKASGCLNQTSENCASREVGRFIESRGLSPHLIAWAAFMRRGMNNTFICLVAPKTSSDITLTAIITGVAGHQLSQPMLVISDDGMESDDHCQRVSVQRVRANSTSVSSCGLVIADLSSDTLESRELAAAIDALKTKHRGQFPMLVLRNVNAAALIAIAAQIPFLTASISGLSKEVETNALFPALSAGERKIASWIVNGRLSIVAADVPLDSTRRTTSTLIVTFGRKSKKLRAFASESIFMMAASTDVLFGPPVR